MQSWHTMCLASAGMKLFFVAALGLAALTGASGPGPLKDSVVTLFTMRDELAQARSEIADLRHGRGMAPPGWVKEYAGALCGSDSTFIVEHTDRSLGMTKEDIEAQFARMHANGLDCTGVRYLGSVGDRQYIFVLHHGPRDTWYLLTLTEDLQAIARVD